MSPYDYGKWTRISPVDGLIRWEPGHIKDLSYLALGTSAVITHVTDGCEGESTVLYQPVLPANYIKVDFEIT